MDMDKKNRILSAITLMLFMAVFSIMFANNAYAASKKSVKSLTLSDKKITMEADTDAILTAEVKASKDGEFNVTAVSSKNRVADVTSNVFHDGCSYITIHAKSPGKAVIKVSTVDKNAKGKKITKKINVTVSENKGSETIFNAWIRDNLNNTITINNDGTASAIYFYRDKSVTRDYTYTFNGTELNLRDGEDGNVYKYKASFENKKLVLENEDGSKSIYEHRVPDPHRQSFNGNLYAVYDVAVSWDLAKDNCEAAGGHLVTIESAEENAFIGSLIQSAAADKPYWIGGYKDKDWQWVTGEKWDYTNWDETKPIIESDKYLEIEPAEGFKWNAAGDDVDGGLLYFICEWEAGQTFDSPLIGTWKSMDTCRGFIFNADGTGAYTFDDGIVHDEQPFWYHDCGTYILISYNDWIDAEYYKYIIKDGVMTFTYLNGETINCELLR